LQIVGQCDDADSAGRIGMVVGHAHMLAQTRGLRGLA
jgi:hypothetical protein